MALDNAIQESIQSGIKDPLQQYGPIDVIPLLAHAGELLSPWWSYRRDKELDSFWKGNDHISGSLSMFLAKTASVPIEIVARNPNIKAHAKQADLLTGIVREASDFGAGWVQSFAPKTIISFITQDNGVFWEIIGDGFKDKPRKGLPLGIAHLDSTRCKRQRNVEFPVLYQDIDGKWYKLHRTRVAFASSMPSQLAEMYGVGFCALSRMINTAQHLIDIATMEQEELGSRPKRQIILGKQGITGQELVSAFQAADQQMDAQGLRRYSKSIIIAPKDRRSAQTPIDLELLSLARALTGEDKEASITLGMFVIALALNIPPRWLWPASSSGATKADAMFQHVAGMGGGIGHLLSVFVSMLGGDNLSTVLGKPVPSYLKVVFDFQDDEQDRAQAEIKDTRSQTRERNLASGSIDIRTAREQMLAKEDITDEQFNRMELKDGRLPNGIPVLTLFSSQDSSLQQMLNLGVSDVLNVEINDREMVLNRIDEKLPEVQSILSNPTNPTLFTQAQQAMIALERLKKEYEKQPELDETPKPDESDEKAKEDAPNYKLSKSLNTVCSNCLWAVENKFCELYDFYFDLNFICDSWEREGDDYFKANDNVMICFYLNKRDANILSPDTPRDDLHVTLALLGRTKNLQSPKQLEKVLKQWAKGQPYVKGHIGGIGRFVDKDVFYATFDSPDFPDFRQELVDLLESGGYSITRDHGYIPHITLAYIDSEDSLPIDRIKRRGIVFKSISLVIGDKRKDMPLGGKKRWYWWSRMPEQIWPSQSLEEKQEAETFVPRGTLSEDDVSENEIIEQAQSENEGDFEDFNQDFPKFGTILET